MEAACIASPAVIEPKQMGSDAFCRTVETSATIILDSTGVFDQPAQHRLPQADDLSELGYEFLAVLGKGTQGVVTKARSKLDGSVVAVKILSIEDDGNANMVKRFRKTAKMASQLDHRNVARILKYGETANMLYLVMEYIDGPSLNDILDKRRRMTVIDSLRIAIKVTSALEHMWSFGITHRDIKPQNILIGKDGVVKLVDLGLAKRSPYGDVAEVPFSTAITPAMFCVGTPAYMSPEQAGGKGEVDFRSDIYSLGIMLFRMITGRIPFSGNPVEVMSAHLLHPLPSPGRYVAHLPRNVDRLIRKMAAKCPDRRFSSPAAFRMTLEKLLRQLEGNRRPTAQHSPEGSAMSKHPSAVLRAPARQASAQSNDHAFEESISKVIPKLREYDGPPMQQSVTQSVPAPVPPSPASTRGDAPSADAHGTAVISHPAPRATTQGLRGNPDLNRPGSPGKALAQRPGTFAMPMLLLSSAQGRQNVAVKLEDGDDVVIGRRGDCCQVILDDPLVSSCHCTLTRTGNTIMVRDNGSLNGTHVDGRKLQSGEFAWLTKRLKVGQTHLRLHAGGIKRA